MKKNGSHTNVPQVSFVVLCYNFSQFIVECIESIYAQAGEYDYEVIVVDDASIDGSDQVINAIKRENVNTIFHSTNLGHVVSLNEAVSLARGEYIARIDGDDRYHPNFLVEALGVFARFPQAGVVYGDVSLVDEKGATTLSKADIFTESSRSQKSSILVQLLEHNFIPAPTLIAKSEIFKKAFPLPLNLHFTDWYINLVLAHSCQIVKIENVVADYRLHSQNLHRNFDSYKYEASILFVLDEVFSRFGDIHDLLRNKGRIYAKAYINAASRHFVAGRLGDARRCYLSALRYRPRLLISPQFMRRSIGSFMTDAQYQYLRRCRDRLKKLFG